MVIITCWNSRTVLHNINIYTRHRNNNRDAGGSEHWRQTVTYWKQDRQNGPV